MYYLQFFLGGQFTPPEVVPQPQVRLRVHKKRRVLNLQVSRRD